MSQSSKGKKKYIFNDETGAFWYQRNYIEGDELFQRLLSRSTPEDKDNSFWELRTGNAMGKTYLFPRLTRHMSDEASSSLSYGGNEYSFHGWSSDMLDLRLRIMEEYNVFLDFCLLNYYRDGNDYISPHKDRESLGRKKITIGVSLGETRTFVITRAPGGIISKAYKPYKEIAGKERDYIWKDCPESKKCQYEFINKDGDIYCMENEFHDNYVHSVPKVLKREGEKGPRISITFRQLIDDGVYMRKGIDTKDVKGMIKRIRKNRGDYLDPRDRKIEERKREKEKREKEKEEEKEKEKEEIFPQGEKEKEEEETLLVRVRKVSRSDVSQSFPIKKKKKREKE